MTNTNTQDWTEGTIVRAVAEDHACGPYYVNSDGLPSLFDEAGVVSGLWGNPAYTWEVVCYPLPAGHRAIPDDVCKAGARVLRDLDSAWFNDSEEYLVADILDPPAPEPEPAAAEDRLFGAEHWDQLFGTLDDAIEHASECDQLEPFTIIEYEKADPRGWMPSAERLVEWLADTMLDDYGSEEPPFGNAEGDTEMLRIAESMRARLAALCGWHWAGKRVAEHRIPEPEYVTLDAGNDEVWEPTVSEWLALQDWIADPGGLSVQERAIHILRADAIEAQLADGKVLRP